MATKKAKQYDGLLRAVIFARVSSREQENGFSIDAQVEKIRNYCASNSLNVIKEFIIVESSTRGERKKFHEMLEFVQRTSGKVVIVADCVDRLQRNYDQHKILGDMCKEDKIEIHFVRDQQIINKDANSSQKLFWNMSVAMAQSYTDCSSDNVKRSVKYRKNRGEWSNIAPFGYLNARDSNNKATLILDEERAPLIRHLFNEYITGMHTTDSLREEARKIKLYSRKSKGKTEILSRAGIYRMLNNPFYFGIMENSEGNYIRHKYDTIIDKETFSKAQKILKNDGEVKKPKITRGYGEIPFAFKSLVLCKTCGSTITPESHTKPSGKVYTYLKCANGKKKCSQPLVSEKALFEQLQEEIFSNIRIPLALLETLKVNIRSHYREENKLNSSIKRKITTEIKQLEDRKEKLFDLFLDNAITKDIYETKVAKIDIQLVDLEKDAAKYTEISEDIANTVESIVDIMANATVIMQSSTPHQQREFLGLLFEYCYLDDKRLIYKLKKPFDKLVVREKGNDWFNINSDNVDEISNLSSEVNHFKSTLLSV